MGLHQVLTCVPTSLGANQAASGGRCTAPLERLVESPQASPRRLHNDKEGINTLVRVLLDKFSWLP